MGFRTGQGEQKTAHIDFAEGHALHGLEIEIGLRLPVELVTAADRDLMGVGLNAFISKVIKWNLDDEAVEVDPATGYAPVNEVVFRRNFDLIECIELITVWLQQVTQPAAPLAQASSGSSSSGSGSTKPVAKSGSPRT